MIDLDSEEIQLVARALPSGLTNVQYVHPLTPQQDGMLLQHILRGAGDTYLTLILFECRTLAVVQSLVCALEFSIDRHETLRSAIQWRGLTRPVQVVYRSADLPVERLDLAAGSDSLARVLDRMKPELHRLDLTRAPLLRLKVAYDGDGGTAYALLLLHHLICDAISMEVLLDEVRTHVRGGAGSLPPPQQFRTHVMRSSRRPPPGAAERFFREMLADFSTPSIPFGLRHRGDEQKAVHEIRQRVLVSLAQRLRAAARTVRVSPAAIFHTACALFIARTSRTEDVVFGTVLSGRLQSGPATQKSIGMFINTLPLRLDLAHATTAEAVSRMHRQLLGLLVHEHIDPTIAHRCSATPPGVQLFSVLLNYIRRPPRPSMDSDTTDIGMSVVTYRAWTNFPFAFIVEDFGEDFELVLQTPWPAKATQALSLFSDAAMAIAEALEADPSNELMSLSIVSAEEQRRIDEEIDRGAPRQDSGVLQQFEPPLGIVEERLAEIWARVLNVDRVGRNQSFFALGGNSLKGLQLLLKVTERFGLQAPAISIFRCPTVRQMAQLIDELSGPASANRERQLDEEEGVI